MLTCFYDIESLDNVFTLCNFIPHEDAVDLFYLVDDQALISEPDFEEKVKAVVYENNKNFTGKIRLFDLKEEQSAKYMAKTFGLSSANMINNPKSYGNIYDEEFRLVCDTDKEFDESKHPYLMGYNSYNYDTTELAYYLYETFPVDSTSNKMMFKPPTARKMRDYNNSLFLSKFKSNMPSRLEHDIDPNTKEWIKINKKESIPYQIRKNMLMSGRHVDVARLNEKQQHVGLKRLIGMMGGQILESNKLKHNQSVIETPEQLYDLIAYNVSDCVNLKEFVFEDRKRIYRGQFELKRGLLRSYPELIYKKLPDKYAPDIRPEAVRYDRLFIDSSSAQLATKSLCPYNHLKDIEVVSFNYPSEEKSKELGIPRVNVLEECKKFFYDNFPQPEVRAEFDRIYNFYKNIEGKNFNSSDNYLNDYAISESEQVKFIPQDIRNFSKANTCMYYYKADGTPSNCFVNFSIGGIHGAEYNETLYKYDCELFENKKFLFDQVKTIFPDPLGLKLAKKIMLKHRDGTSAEHKASEFIKSGSTKDHAEYKDIEKERPKVFNESKSGAWELNKKYVYTSADPTNHEDFTSYYPNLLRMMSAFYNDGLGYDRYAEK